MNEEKHSQMMKSWIDIAKGCGQLSTAAMFLPLFVTRDLVGVGKDNTLHGGVNGWFFLAWTLFIVSIALAQTYQISATTLINRFGMKNVPRLYPRTQFWLMVTALLLGMSAFVGGTLEVLKLPTTLAGNLAPIAK